ncbi:DUF3830 family protein [Sphingosinicella xenopeptidilytica]|uniref:DUF3830 family protein n=1 Tax=Sphingosinicella xenopeptidilytica TaxID=364098 RepID=A0ABW3C632_SPHXN
MTDIRITAGDLVFLARLEHALAPETCRYFLSLLPYKTQFVHVRWSGEGCWVPLGDVPVPFTFENATSYPAPGQMIFYPGGYSETEILLAYGAVSFASKLGQLAGNHFLTIVEGLDQLPTLGKRALWQGAQDVLIESLS